ncbi:ABC-2 type transporter-domain-containing protein [Mycotypha africana]|uniref:ABC-2 type transporter-domain-containing protein n=1 Tax=Mycotypha africana TaxID=64632 RepID=UPI0022FFE08B|nr:ABC-2 type transporter-domain-containing protein [Mycotypha africana]KAI8969248.1 ABC-2 type transporter-domain-containing protein [Mycotypha africana]
MQHQKYKKCLVYLSLQNTNVLTWDNLGPPGPISVFIKKTLPGTFSRFPVLSQTGEVCCKLEKFFHSMDETKNSSVPLGAENKNIQNQPNFNDDAYSTNSTVNTALRDYGHRDTFGEAQANQVNVKDAIQEYQSLRRELTSRSQHAAPSMMEEGQADADVFNLDEFLHGITEERDANGLSVRKKLGVAWTNLRVEGLGADAYTIPTFFSYVTAFLTFWKKKKTSTKVILDNLSGCCRDGEMLLVLGRPGAGCSSFLKVISNLRDSYTHIGGEVTYGGIDHKTFAERYRGQVCYNEEEDQHYPTLTTKQTLQFALRTKTPGNRLPNETKKDFVNRLIYLLGNMLGLTKQMDTMVGNAFVRGLSGGERKRLSIAEQMTTNSSINCWDCSTRGLDAASALDYVRSLRIMTDIFNITTIATLYQASNSIFNVFDKILLLDEGYCIYYGPVTEAKRYFENLGFHCPPRKSIPDFLTGICNPLEREIRPGFEETAPAHACEFQKVYYNSDIYKLMLEDLDNYKQTISAENKAQAFQDAVREEHQKRAPKKSPYIASFFQQVKALTIREHYLMSKDVMSLISRYGTMLIQGLVTASCFYALPMDGQGAFSRAGAIFFSAMFNTFISQSELVRFLMGRPVLEKHKQYALYRPSAYYIAQVILDIPYTLAQVLLYSICSYFMMGLNLTAGKFFTSLIFLFFLSMCMTGFFRFFGSITSSFFFATQLTGIILLATTTYTGYTIPYNKMHPWLFWIYYINPITYTYKGLISNEMDGQIYSCEGPGNAIPFGPGYDDWNYKVCTMQGGNPGEPFVRGEAYLETAYSYHAKDLWAPDFVVVVAFFIFFTILTALSMEYVKLKKSSTLTKLYLPGKAPKSRTIEEEDERRRKQNEITENMGKISTGTTFSWQHVNYTVPIKGGSIQLLNDIGGIVRPGHLTALMGSSGAGKTTLLDVLARRKTIGKVEGEIFLNGEALMNDFERITGYCEQMDIHQPAVTVREALCFSAQLRQPADVPIEEKNNYVEQIIQLLEMEDIADAQIGSVESGFGISIEERKRLTIGMELVGKPQLLFLDEPTSGLDAQSSYNIIRFIRKLADAGWPVLCTIHQPSAVLFEHFDHLLLLVRGGRTAYHGEIGKDSRTMIEYFESNGGPTCSPDANPAEYILEVVGAGTAGKVTQDWAEIWAASKEAKALQNELDEIARTADKNPTREAKTYATPYVTQFKLVFSRMSLAYWRSVDYNVGRSINIMFNALLTGFTFWKLGSSSTDMQYKVFALFGTFIMAFTLIFLAQPKFITERTYFRREYASRYYSWLPWAISAILVELPYIIFFAAFFMFGFYWTTGMRNTSEACGYFYIAFVVLVFWSVSIGFVLAAISESPTTAALLNPTFLSVLILFCGLMQSPKAMPKFWSSWMYWLDPFHYYIEGLTVNELAHLKITCTDQDLLRFTPPPGQTCGEYTANFFASGATGYIANPDAMQPEQCGYCTFKSGPEFYETTIGWNAANKWRNFGILIAYAVFNVIVFITLVYLRRKPRR